MAKLDASIRVLHFEDEDHLPSPLQFSTSIEPLNVPAVFKGAVKNWDAVSKWNPANGGLDYLAERVGSANVDAMLSSSAPVFYGDVRSHERVCLSFNNFIASCKLYAQNVGNTSSSIDQEDTIVVQTNSEESCLTISDSPDQLYLAQVPIFSMESKMKPPLEILFNDIQMPVVVAMKTLASINLWMNRARSRSSTHYDPYHNLLCIAAGSKRVVLWPPSACPLLYPMPIQGESSNHSAVNLENPDLSVHSRAKDCNEYSQTVILYAGDALFIPEGWFHQVDSDDLTIAVNFWWKSNVMSNMLEHMDAYYLRRILNRLVGKEMNSMVQKISIDSREGKENCIHTNEASVGCSGYDLNSQMENSSGKSEEWWKLEQLEPFATNLLYEIITFVHEAVKICGQIGSEECISSSLKDECKQTTKDNPSLYLSDPVARIFWTAEPLVLRKVLLALAHNFPRTLEALILHVLSPIGAEVLTRKFDQMDQQITKEEQVQFYQIFYSVFDDPNVAMDAILKGKEAFAFQAVQNVLDQFLGLCIDKPNYLHH